MPVSSLPEEFALRLAELPEFAPPQALRERIMHRLAPPARRRWPLPAALAAAAVLALAMLLAPRLQGPDTAPPVVASADPVAASQARSRALEADLAATPRDDAAGGSAGILAAEAELARVDLALQSAYDRNAPATELEPLWRQRTDLLGMLVAAYRNPASLVRI